MQGAWIAFVAWAVKFVGLHPEVFEKSCEGMSELLAGYIEYTYKSGKPFSHGKLALLAVQDRYRSMRKHLQSAWDTLSTWELEIPLSMHTPIPPTLMWALFSVGALLGLSSKGALARRWFGFSVGCVCMFWGLLRPGELFALTFGDTGIYECGKRGRHLLLSIKRPKNQRQMGKKQVAIVENAVAMRWLQWLSAAGSSSEHLMKGGRVQFVHCLTTALQYLGISSKSFSPASFRSGGATELYLAGTDMARIRLLGRWKHLNTVDHYVQHASAILAGSELSTMLPMLRQLLKCTGCLRHPPPQPAEWFFAVPA